MRRIFIYKILSPAGNLYIGKTTNYIKRKYKHKSDFRYSIKRGKRLSLLQESFKEHGFDRHEFNVIYEVVCNNDFADYLERHYIRLFCSCAVWGGGGLNISDGGTKNNKYLKIHGFKQAAFSEDTKYRMGLAQSKNMNRPERKEISRCIMNRLWSEGKINKLYNPPKYKSLIDDKLYSMAEIVKIEGACDSGIAYHFRKYGHYKNKYSLK